MWTYVLRHTLLDDFRVRVPGRFAENLIPIPSKNIEDALLPSLGNEYHMVLTVPPRVVGRWYYFTRESAFSWRRIEIHG